ncbi:MAG: VOC family protein [Oceanobacter sp.]
MQSNPFKFSHLGFFATDLVKMEAFYTGLLGLTVTDRGELPGENGPVSLVFMSKDPDEHHQVVLISGRPADMSYNPINQISFKGSDLQSLRDMHNKLIEMEADDIQPVTHGNALSIYARDPEGNRLELYIDMPWYVTQPMRVPADLTLNDEDLMAALEEHARALPGFRPRSEWRAEIAAKMGVA